MATRTKAEARRIEYLPLADLRENTRNPRTHDEGTIDGSVGRFGYLEPIVRDERTGLIVSGHGRKKVLISMHERGETVPEGCRVLPNGDWAVPVVVGWASRTDNEAAAALIALNRTTELGGWVDDALLELLDDLSVMDQGLVGVGFGDAEMAVLRDRLDAVAQEGFLDDLADQDASNPFIDNKNWMAVEEATLSLSFANTDIRRSVVRALAAVKNARGLESNSDALLSLLEIEIPTPEPAP